MYIFLVQLAAFTLYTLALLLLTGQTFSWNETRRLFYLGASKYKTPVILAAFCATWLSASSMLGYTTTFLQEGYIAFASTVNGWMLGFLFLPFLVYRLRSRDVLSIPEWLEAEYQDSRLRYMGGFAILVSFTLYLIIQFRAFGDTAAYLLQMPAGFTASALIYLFVLYTTFGGFPAVVRSNSLNMLLILFGVAIGLYAAIKYNGSPMAAHALIAESDPGFLSWRRGDWSETLNLLPYIMVWILGTAVNPQFGNMLLAARDTKSAIRLTMLAPLFVGAVYIGLTLLAVIGKAYFGDAIPIGESGLPVFYAGMMPAWGAVPLILAGIAAAVSTANAELLIASSALCYDMLPLFDRSREHRKGPFEDDAFLFSSRFAIVVIATVALVASQLPLPRILDVASISWTFSIVFFFFPLFVKFEGQILRRYIFWVSTASLMLNIVLIFYFNLLPGASMLMLLGMQALVYLSISLWERFYAY